MWCCLIHILIKNFKMFESQFNVESDERVSCIGLCLILINISYLEWVVWIITFVNYNFEVGFIMLYFNIVNFYIFKFDEPPIKSHTAYFVS